MQPLAPQHMYIYADCIKPEVALLLLVEGRRDGGMRRKDYCDSLIEPLVHASL